MTKRTCLTCGTVFEDTFSFFTCATCKQTKAMTKAIEEQNDLIRQRQYNVPQQPAYVPVYTPPSDIVYIPPTAEEMKLRNKYRTINALLKILFVAFPFVAAIVLWFITSGWVTVATLLLIPFIMKILYDQHWNWQVKHSQYLFRI